MDAGDCARNRARRLQLDSEQGQCIGGDANSSCHYCTITSDLVEYGDDTSGDIGQEFRFGEDKADLLTAS
jgi:hypothetical protein